MTGMEPPAQGDHWSHLRSNYLVSLGEEESARVFDLASQASETLDSWAANYPLIRRRRVRPLALSVAAAAPFASSSAIASTAKTSLWIFTLDDIFDEQLRPEEQLLSGARAYRAIASGDRPVTGVDELAAALIDLREELAGYTLFPDLAASWANALSLTIDGMIQESRWHARYRKNHNALPSFETYLRCGRYSIGGPPHVWSALITTGDPSTERFIAHLRRMERLASESIRLANDLRSHRKEVAERGFNSLVILSKAAERRGLRSGEAMAAAAADVRAAIQRRLDSLGYLEQRQQTESGQPEAAIRAIAQFVCEFYDRYDYHTFANPLRAPASLA